MKKNLFKLLLSFFVVALSLNSSAFAMEFIDVPHGFWAYREIDTLTNEKFISGYNQDYFMPNNLVTRAEYAAMVVKVLGQEDIPVETMYSFEANGVVTCSAK